MWGWEHGGRSQQGSLASEGFPGFPPPLLPKQRPWEEARVSLQDKPLSMSHPWVQNSEHFSHCHEAFLSVRVTELRQCARAWRWVRWSLLSQSDRLAERSDLQTGILLQGWVSLRTSWGRPSLSSSLSACLFWTLGAELIQSYLSVRGARS